MDETTYPFVDWIDLPQPDGSVRSRVIEDVQIGADCWRNRAPLTQVEVFSSCVRPTRLTITSDKAVGLFAENRDGEYFFYGVFEDVAVGETVRLNIWVEGQYTKRAKVIFSRDCYQSNFAWLNPHVQRIVFPKGYRIAAVTPQDGVIGQWRGQPSVVWRRSGEFWGEVRVQFKHR